MNLFSHKRDLREIIGELQVGAQKEREEQQEQYSKIREKELERDLKEQREYESIESDISELENKISDMEKRLSDPKIASDFVQLNKLGKEKEELENELEEKTNRYFYLEELAEKIANQ